MSGLPVHTVTTVSDQDTHLVVSSPALRTKPPEPVAVRDAVRAGRRRQGSRPIADIGCAAACCGPLVDCCTRRPGPQGAVL